MSEQEKTFVSVIIPTYNRAPTLPRAINSVLHQDYRNLELIIVDDASTDDTEALVENIKDHRIRYVRHDRNQGACAARNTGIAAAKGELIAFQDSDDEWLEGKLSKQVAALDREKSEYVLVYCTKIIYGMDGNYKRGVRRSICVPGPETAMLSGDLRQSLWHENIISTQTILVRTESAHKVGGFDTRLKNSQDWDFVLRISEVGSFAFVDEPLVNHYIQADSISNLSSTAPYSQLIIINKLKRRGVPAKVLAGRRAILGYRIGKLGSPRRGEVLIWASLLAQPTEVKTWGRFLVNRLRRHFHLADRW